jgi:hypothetical protein
MLNITRLRPCPIQLTRLHSHGKVMLDTRCDACHELDEVRNTPEISRLVTYLQENNQILIDTNSRLLFLSRLCIVLQDLPFIIPTATGFHALHDSRFIITVQAGLTKVMYQTFHTSIFGVWGNLSLLQLLSADLQGRICTVQEGLHDASVLARMDRGHLDIVAEIWEIFQRDGFIFIVANNVLHH